MTVNQASAESAPKSVADVIRNTSSIRVKTQIERSESSRRAESVQWLERTLEGQSQTGQSPKTQSSKSPTQLAQSQTSRTASLPNDFNRDASSMSITHCDDSRLIRFEDCDRTLSFKSSDKFVYLLVSEGAGVMLCSQQTDAMVDDGDTALLRSGVSFKLTAVPGARVSVLLIPVARMKSAALNYGVIWQDAEQAVSIQSEPALVRLMSELAEPSIDCFSDQIRLHRLKTCEALILRNWRTDSRSLISAKPVADKIADGFRRLVMAAITEDVDLEELADRLGVSSRTLYQRTRRYFGLSPALLIRHLKIEAVFEVLKHEADMTCVTRVAIEHGFTNLGRFAQQYRQHLGELPSETLGRHRKGSAAA